MNTIKIDLTEAAYTYAGMRLIETREAVTRSEDWSRCRSRSRAERRRRQGHRQNVVVVETPTSYRVGKDMIAVHPDIMRQIKDQLSREVDQQAENVVRWGDGGMTRRRG